MKMPQLQRLDPVVVETLSHILVKSTTYSVWCRTRGGTLHECNLQVRLR